jgi:hypothetical protein
MQQASGEPASIFDIISILEEQSPMKLKLWVGCRVQHARRTGMTLQLAASSTKPGKPANHFVTHVCHDTYRPHEIPVWLSMLSNLPNATNHYHRDHHETLIILPICTQRYFLSDYHNSGVPHACCRIRRRARFRDPQPCRRYKLCGINKYGTKVAFSTPPKSNMIVFPHHHPWS